MAFKDTWRPRVDDVDEADSSAVNEIAEEVIRLGENQGGIVDAEMSDTSENAVQNKVIKTYVDDITGNISTALDELHSYAQNLVGGDG